MQKMCCKENINIMILIIGKMKMKLKRIYIHFSRLPVIENIFIESIISRVRVVVFNASFHNISFILWQSVLLVEEARVPRENHRPCLKSLTNFIT